MQYFDAETLTCWPLFSFSETVARHTFEPVYLNDFYTTKLTSRADRKYILCNRSNDNKCNFGAPVRRALCQSHSSYSPIRYSTVFGPSMHGGNAYYLGCLCWLLRDFPPCRSHTPTGLHDGFWHKNRRVGIVMSLRGHTSRWPLCLLLTPWPSLMVVEFFVADMYRVLAVWVCVPFWVALSSPLKYTDIPQFRHHWMPIRQYIIFSHFTLSSSLLTKAPSILAALNSPPYFRYNVIIFVGQVNSFRQMNIYSPKGSSWSSLERLLYCLQSAYTRLAQPSLNKNGGMFPLSVYFWGTVSLISWSW